MFTMLQKSLKRKEPKVIPERVVGRLPDSEFRRFNPLHEAKRALAAVLFILLVVILFLKVVVR